MHTSEKSRSLDSRSFGDPGENASCSALPTPPSPSLRSTSRRRDNHINRAITCLCISIIPWRCVDPGQDTGYILRVLSCSLFLCLTHTQTHTRASRTSRNLELSSRLPGGELKLGQKGESREKLQRTTLISLIELSTRDCCNYDYL